MSIATGLKYLGLAYLSKPASDRILYRTIRQTGVQKILELGIGDTRRAQRLVAVAANFGPAEAIRYTGIDRFETRDDETAGRLTLKEAYCCLKSTGARTQLLPCESMGSLLRFASMLASVDLAIVSRDQNRPFAEQFWGILPRLLHPKSCVMVEEADERGRVLLRQLTWHEVEAQAARVSTRRAA